MEKEEKPFWNSNPINLEIKANLESMNNGIVFDYTKKTMENPFYRKVTKEEATWRPSRVNDGWEMTRVNPETNYIDVRLLKWWERIIYWKF